jgi:hypothetical protein
LQILIYGPYIPFSFLWEVWNFVNWWRRTWLKGEIAADQTIYTETIKPLRSSQKPPIKIEQFLNKNLSRLPLSDWTGSDSANPRRKIPRQNNNLIIFSLRGAERHNKRLLDRHQNCRFPNCNSPQTKTKGFEKNLPNPFVVWFKMSNLHSNSCWS